jgi:hypothetical protein
MESVQQQPQLANVTNNSNTNNIATKLTPEQEEEQKLRSKYPNPQKPGGSAFVQKLLHKGVCDLYKRPFSSFINILI